MTMGDGAAAPSFKEPLSGATRSMSAPKAWAIWSTGIHAGIWIAFNAYYLISGETPSGTSHFVAALTAPLSWLLLSEWTCRAAAVRRRQRVTLPSDMWIWFAWLVPIASLFSPAKTLHRISRGAVSMGLLLTWWLPWLLANGLSVGAASGDDAPSHLLVEAVAILVSWTALATIIRRISAKVVI